jgi:valyl-tRNA synthetase
VPFRDVYIHALVRDADRQKMSKTKGNVIDPIEIVTKYGTDAVRFTLASQASPGTDIAFNEARTEGYRAFANKIWNAARFLQMNIERGREAGYKVSLSSHDSISIELPRTRPLETRWIFSRLSTVSDSVAHSLADYRFDEAANAVYQFFWGEFCDWYLELVKLRMDFFPDEHGVFKPHSDVAAITLNALVSVFEAALRLLSPFMPFLTEELWHALYASVGTDSPQVHRPHPLSAGGRLRRRRSEPRAMTTLQELIVTIRGLRKELAVPEKEFTPIQLHASARSPLSPSQRRHALAASPASAPSRSRPSQPSPATTPAPPPPSTLPSSTSARSTSPPSASASPRTSPNTPRASKPPTSSSATKASSPAPPHTSSKASQAARRNPRPQTKTEAALAALPPE